MKKLLVTLGPASFDGGIIRKMDELGVDIFRINLSHTSLDQVEKNIKFIKEHSDTPICLDSEGAQIRNQQMTDGTHFENGSIVKVHFREVVGDAENISFSPKGIAEDFTIGDVINIDFDHAAIEIIEKKNEFSIAKVIKSGVIVSNRAVDISRDIKLPAITEKDEKAFKIGLDYGIKNFALSFAGCGEDVRKMRDLVGQDSNIICKIESMEGLINLKEILNLTNDILIDRGDLSRQIPIEKIPFLQRRIISMAKIYDKPVYVATNLLESMLKNRSPTRAEVNDVVSTIIMGADGLVLAAETAIGKHPAAAVEILQKTMTQCRRWTPNTNILEILEM